MYIKRKLYGVVTEDGKILVGNKITLRFIPFGEVKARDNVVLYESLKKAYSALNSSAYFDSLKKEKYDIIPIEETLMDWKAF